MVRLVEYEETSALRPRRPVRFSPRDGLVPLAQH